MAVRIESQAEPIPGYRLLERLGGGGFGEVWKAEAPGGLLKAIKFVYGELDAAGDDAQRAEQELKSIKRVQSVRHPYILSLERYDIIDGQLLIVMELADRNLWDRFKECRGLGQPGIPREELLGYMSETAEALDLMNNQHGLQHLDIKPQNLFLVHNHIKVADFGLVKDLEGMAASVTGGVTPVYAAPETFDNWVSRFSDQYSLAIVYQEMLTGKRPFPGGNVRQLVMQHLQGTPDLSSLGPEDAAVVGRALSKNPDQRHPTCLDMVRALRGSGATTTWSDPGIALATPPPPSTTRCVPVVGDLRDQESAAPDAEVPPLTRMKQHVAPLTPHPGAGVSERPTDWLRAPSITPTAAPSSGRSPPTDPNGGLRPTLVIGLGGLGLTVLRRLRRAVNSLVGSPDVVPHLRLLHLDTDPEEVRSAGRPIEGVALVAGESQLIRLQRPSHYLKPREGRVDTSSWLDPKMLYRIPRTQLTGGCRALGRLAFFDNYRLVAQKIRSDLESCASPEALAAATRQTGLALHSTRPQVMIVAGLAGGTGGGAFLDLAFVVRDALRHLGHADPDVNGVLLVPPAGRDSQPGLGLGNTYAALTELCHFQRSAGYSVRFLEREPVVADSSPPFGRCVMIPLTSAKGGPDEEAIATAAELLAREAVTPWGQAASEARRAIPVRPKEPMCQIFGLYKISFPRRDLVARVSRQLCAGMVDRWMCKDGSKLRDPVRAWLKQHWSREDYGPEMFIERLQDEAEKALGDAPEAIFAGVVRDLAGVSSPDPLAVRNALAHLETLVGRPGEGTLADRPCRFLETLRTASDPIVAEWGQHLADVVIGLIETPGMRLAGAEEAIRFVIASFEQMLEHQEPLARELANRATETHARILALAAHLENPSPQKARNTTKPVDASELLRAYPKWRFQSLVMQEVARGLVALRGLVSDELREINFCRSRLDELRKAFLDPPSAADDARLDPNAPGGCPGRTLLPFKQAGIDEGVKLVLQQLTPEHLEAIEDKVQAMIRRQFSALIHVCLTPTNMLRNLVPAMSLEVESALKGSLNWGDITELFLEQEGGDEAAGRDAILSAYEEATSELASNGTEGRQEISVLAVPEGASGERFRTLATEALPGVRLTHVSGGEDVLLYREMLGVPIAGLPQLGTRAREAYERLGSAQHYTPHARNDIAFRSVGL